MAAAPPRLALRRFPKLAVYAVGLAPAAWTLHLGLADRLGPEPIRALEQALGLWSLRFLLACLFVKPLRRLFGVDLSRYRRALGLLAFYYAALHLSAYVALDHGLDWRAVWADIVKRPYVTVGAASFVILVPLAATSSNAAIRRMGGRAWAKLHRLVYAAAIAAALHFLLIVKSWPLEPLVYAAIAVALVLYRAYPVSLPRRVENAEGSRKAKS